MFRHVLAALGALAVAFGGALPATAVQPPAIGSASVSASSTGTAVSAGTAVAAAGGDKDSTGRTIPQALQESVSGQVVAQTKAIKWTRCGGGMQCATLTVPLNYDNPASGTIDLTVTRRPADKPGRRLGVLFTNPGGPGGPAAYTVPTFAQVLGRDVRARFDIIGVNPRGTGDDQFALCQGKPGQQTPQLPEWVFPTTPAQAQTQIAFDAFVVGLCRSSNLPVLKHMSSGDSARDLDAVRAALGEKTMNYYGISYGSHLGATYSQLFPQRVRTMVVDGTLDPIAWTGGRGNDAATTPMTARLGSGIGAHKALMSAIAECERVGGDYCEEHKTIRQDWTLLQESLREKPIELMEGFSLSHDMVVAMVLGGLYDYEGVPDVLSMVTLLNQLSQAGATPPEAVVAQARAIYGKVKARDERNRRYRLAYDPPAPPEEEQPTPMYYAGFEGVACDDGKQPRDPQAWVRAAMAAERTAPGFGPLWTWRSSMCAHWPFRSPGALRGNFSKPAQGGMLIMNTTHDPATPYSGALAMRALRTDSRMITVPGWGHAVLDTSGCATKARTQYLVSGSMPALDRRCRQDHKLFTSLK